MADQALYVAFEEYKIWDSSHPEKNLLRGVLSTALDDLKKGGELARDARRFFMSEEDSHLYSFVNICEQLGICPKTIRSMIGIQKSTYSKVALLHNSASAA